MSETNSKPEDIIMEHLEKWLGHKNVTIEIEQDTHTKKSLQQAARKQQQARKQIQRRLKQNQNYREVGKKVIRDLGLDPNLPSKQHRSFIKSVENWADMDPNKADGESVTEVLTGDKGNKHEPSDGAGESVAEVPTGDNTDAKEATLPVSMSHNNGGDIYRYS